MKEKLVAMLKLLLPIAVLFVIGMSLGNAPVAQATSCKECLLEPCAYPYTGYGWVVNRILVQSGSTLVLTKFVKCPSQLGGATLYWDCQEYGDCVSYHNKPGLLFHLDRKNEVTVFNIKDRKEADAIEASLDYQGLDITVGKWKPRVVLSASELANPSIQTLSALGFAQSNEGCAAGK